MAAVASVKVLLFAGLLFSLAHTSREMFVGDCRKDFSKLNEADVAAVVKAGDMVGGGIAAVVVDSLAGLRFTIVVLITVVVKGDRGVVLERAFGDKGNVVGIFVDAVLVPVFILKPGI